MAALESIRAQYLAQKRLIGEAALHALYPKDVNYMFLSMELVDSQGNTVDYFSWPVLPDELRETHQELTQVQKTLGGIKVTKNSTFAPKQISIRGTFGRDFKVLVGSTKVEFAGFGFSTQNGNFNVTSPNLLGSKIPQLSSFIKTGYGCVKLVESIKDKLKDLDSNSKPFALYLYNPVLGNNYQVEITNFTHMQDSNQNNMVPGYTLSMTAVAPLNELLGRKAMMNASIKNLSIANIQKSANQLASDLRRTIREVDPVL